MNFTKELKKSQNDCYNRLHSIFLLSFCASKLLPHADDDYSDAEFVGRVADVYKAYPLIANQRCGVWYINPNLASYRPDIYAYFKSTDGHTNAWSFSLRRPNLHLLDHILDNRGVVIVDSTRRGKRFPDALSKTIPIWCAVVSSEILNTSPEALLFTPPNAISESEKQSIKDSLGTWRQWLADSALQLNRRLDKPLRPIFVHPETRFLPDFSNSTLDFYPVICVSASRYIPDQIERHPWGEYVQGSGDDHELWSKGLTPESFWEHHEDLLGCSSDMLDICVDEIVSESIAHSTKNVGIANDRFLGGVIYPSPSETQVPSLEVAFVALTPESPLRTKNTMHVKVPKSSKQAQREFLAQLPHVMLFVKERLEKGKRVAVSDANGGTDLASVVCVAAATLFFNEKGERVARNETVSKVMINTRLQWLINAYPSSNPSRVSLKRMNDYLM